EEEVPNLSDEHGSSTPSRKRIGGKGQQKPDGRHQDPPRKGKGRMG
ncbi:hypothetical protein Tco_0504195, partial [Tanacetum coccineum]